MKDTADSVPADFMLESLLAKSAVQALVLAISPLMSLSSELRRMAKKAPMPVSTTPTPPETNPPIFRLRASSGDEAGGAVAPTAPSGDEPPGPVPAAPSARWAGFGARDSTGGGGGTAGG